MYTFFVITQVFFLTSIVIVGHNNSRTHEDLTFMKTSTKDFVLSVNSVHIIYAYYSHLFVSIRCIATMGRITGLHCKPATI